jgi:CTP synthase
MKYICVFGGPISTLGKGTVSSCLGMLLRNLGFVVTMIKIDPYYNVDAGLMSPYDHGECFVLSDKTECDLDLGTYERFVDLKLTKYNSITNGKIFFNVLEKERTGVFLGKTVQAIPHITDEIKLQIKKGSTVKTIKGKSPEICIIECGGTVGDIESLLFLEAIRQLQLEVGKDNLIIIYVSLLIAMGKKSEQKTKPTQSGLSKLLKKGLNTDFLICRCKYKIKDETINKLSSLSGITKDFIIKAHNVDNIYQFPQLLQSQFFVEKIVQKLQLRPSFLPEKNYLEICNQMVTQKFENFSKIAIVGKYVKLKDCYISIINSLQYAAFFCRKKLQILWVSAEKLEKDNDKAWNKIKYADGILVPGGFDDRGINGMMLAIKYAREYNIPYLGICLGFQLAIIEFCRNVLNLKNADSEEFDKNNEKDHVIVHMDKLEIKMGGTMRLGEKNIYFNNGIESKLLKFYNMINNNDLSVYKERFRHRYELNPSYRSLLEENGMCIEATNKNGKRLSVFEIKNLKYFVGVQYHPEFTSKLYKPNPCFVGLIGTD